MISTTTGDPYFLNHLAMAQSIPKLPVQLKPFCQDADHHVSICTPNVPQQNPLNQEALSNSYREALQRRLGEIFTEHHQITRTELFSRMRGAFPAVVQAHLATMGLGDRVTAAREDTSLAERVYRPELHPLNFEWYFVSDCAKHLARWLPIRHRKIVCLGTPTVAEALCEMSLRPRLIDSNAAILRRFPLLRRSASIQVRDVSTASEIGRKADALIFDPPWYVDDTLQWMIVAARLTRLRGIIAFSLFPPLTRPGAEQERQAVLAFASTIGQVEVVENVLVYQTPLFEREALLSSQIREAGNWRRGDLVIVEVKHPGSQLAPRTAHHSQWQTFFVSGQVVKLRRRCGLTPNDQAPLSTIEGCSDFVYPTVSARDSRQESIDFWTSRNRVARVGDFDLVTKILWELQNGARLSDAIRRARPECAASDSTQSLEDSFRKLLAEEG
jgi:hypothetical protein